MPGWHVDRQQVDKAVEVEDGTVPTQDWFLNLQILTSEEYCQLNERIPDTLGKPLAFDLLHP
jgi:hypothetical protein